MTALEIIEAVKSAGGRLTLRGKKVSCRIPDNADAKLIEALREQRDGVARLLRLQQEQYVGKDNRCYTHGTHEEWYRHPGDGPDRVCAKSTQELNQIMLRNEDDDGELWYGWNEQDGSIRRCDGGCSFPVPEPQASA